MSISTSYFWLIEYFDSRTYILLCFFGYLNILVQLTFDIVFGGWVLLLHLLLRCLEWRKFSFFITFTTIHVWYLIDIFNSYKDKMTTAKKSYSRQVGIWQWWRVWHSNIPTIHIESDEYRHLRQRFYQSRYHHHPKFRDYCDILMQYWTT